MAAPTTASELDKLTMRIDYASATVEYYGYAATGTATSAAFWRIRRRTLDANGRTTAMQSANGTDDFISVWDNRASLVYS